MDRVRSWSGISRTTVSGRRPGAQSGVLEDGAVDRIDHALGGAEHSASPASDPRLAEHPARAGYPGGGRDSEIPSVYSHEGLALPGFTQFCGARSPR